MKNETQVHGALIMTNKIQQLEAKLQELTQWDKEGVYDEINNNGQERIFLRWVITKKVNNGSKFAKASFCTRGFEEEKIFEVIVLLAQESIFALPAVSYLQTNGYSIH